MILVYIAAIVLANLSIAHFGPWVAPINSFLLIGLDLSLRDRLHDKWRGDRLALRMFALIAAAGGISYLLNPAAGQIAIASAVAFMCAAAADALAYQAAIRLPWVVRANSSNAAGALVDSIVFPALAFGGLNLSIVAAMFAAKVAGGAVWAWVLSRARLGRIAQS